MVSAAQKLPIDLMYYVVPPSDMNVVQLSQKIETSLFGREYTFLRAIDIVPLLRNEKNWGQVGCTVPRNLYGFSLIQFPSLLVIYEIQ